MSGSRLYEDDHAVVVGAATPVIRRLGPTRRELPNEPDVENGRSTECPFTLDELIAEPLVSAHFVGRLRQVAQSE